MYKKLSFRLKSFIAITIVTFILIMFVYGEVQYVLRSGANDPQIQMAEDFAMTLSNGTSPQSIVGTTAIDIRKSLSPFVIIYDEKGRPVASSGYFDEAMPVPPQGVFQYVRENGQDRITWQPEKGVRVATVVRQFKSAKSTGFILVGRSLYEVETRTDDAFILALSAWCAIVFVSGLGLAFLKFRSK